MKLTTLTPAEIKFILDPNYSKVSDTLKVTLP